MMFAHEGTGSKLALGALPFTQSQTRGGLFFRFLEGPSLQSRPKRRAPFSPGGLGSCSQHPNGKRSLVFVLPGSSRECIVFFEGSLLVGFKGKPEGHQQTWGFPYFNTNPWSCVSKCGTSIALLTNCGGLDGTFGGPTAEGLPWPRRDLPFRAKFCRLEKGVKQGSVYISPKAVFQPSFGKGH